MPGAVALPVMTQTAPPMCALVSREREEPLTATASRVERWLLVEHRGAWGPESVPSSRMTKPVARAIAEHAATARARLLLVRRPGRHAPGEGRWVYAVDSRPGLERLLGRHLTDDADLLDLAPPFGDQDASGWSPVEGPLYLVCTHGRNDRCCALRGRPVAHALAAAHPDNVWECSHVGGDRFAANVVVLPEGLFLGKVEPEEAVEVLAALEDGLLPAGLVRGRSSLPLPSQAAQQFAREATGRWGRHDLAPTLQEPAGPDAWRVVLSDDLVVVVAYDRHGDGAAHVLSCGDPAKTAPLFRLVSLEPVA